MIRRPRLRRLLAAGGCAAAITAVALAGTAPAASASTSATLSGPGGIASTAVGALTTQENNAVTAGGAKTSHAVTPAFTYYVEKIKSWDGYCLSVPNANVGTKIDQAPCASASNWWVNATTSDMYPAGHATAQVGDSGGYLQLKSPGTGTPVYYDGTAVGPGGETYAQVWFGVAGTFWHANGNGNDVTFDGLAGDHANYWWFDTLGTS